MGMQVVVGGEADDRSFEEVLALVHLWDGTFSRFHDGSELNHVNASKADALCVSERFARVLRVGLAAARATDGLVDPTLGGALLAAGYDRDFAVLGADAMAPGRPECGHWRDVSVAGRLLSRPPGTVLDLNGVVKGLVVDEALRLLPPPSFVAIGGDVAASGEIAVGLPRGGSILLRSGGLATSGTTRRRWLRAGGEQHHLIDPRTGRSSCSRWDEVTVAASSCLAADIAAKAAFLLSDDGPEWLDERGLPGRFLVGATVTLNDAWRLAVCVDRIAA